MVSAALFCVFVFFLFFCFCVRILWNYPEKKNGIFFFSIVRSLWIWKTHEKKYFLCLYFSKSHEKNENCRKTMYCAKLAAFTIAENPKWRENRLFAPFWWFCSIFLWVRLVESWFLPVTGLWCWIPGDCIVTWIYGSVSLVMISIIDCFYGLFGCVVYIEQLVDCIIRVLFVGIIVRLCCLYRW